MSCLPVAAGKLAAPPTVQPASLHVLEGRLRVQAEGERWDLGQVTSATNRHGRPRRFTPAWRLWRWGPTHVRSCLQAAALVPIGGLLTSTLLTLVFVRAIYAICDDMEDSLGD